MRTDPCRGNGQRKVPWQSENDSQSRPEQAYEFDQRSRATARWPGWREPVCATTRCCVLWSCVDAHDALDRFDEAAGRKILDTVERQRGGGAGELAGASRSRRRREAE